MIKDMMIKDSPAFREATLECHSGLNVITGASGAGKSVFFHSLLAFFGLKDCNASLLEARLWGEFDLKEYLEEGEVGIQIIKKDKTRYFINHQSSSKKRLGEIFSPYVKFLSHKNSNELESDFLLNLLDLLSKDLSHQAKLSDYKEKFKAQEEMQKRLKELREQEKNLSNLKEFTLFEIEKIQSLQPKIGEYEELLGLKKMLSKKEKLQSLAQSASQALEGMSKVSAFLEALEIKVDGYDEMIFELENLIANEMDQLSDLEAQDPELILDRLSKLSSLISRYGSIEEALQYLKEQQDKLKDYESVDENTKELQEAITQQALELESLAQDISKIRKQSLPLLENQLKDCASLLLLQGIKLTLEQTQIQHNGIDHLSITLKDSNLQTLSSGEYNRLRLAVLAVEQGKNAGILLLDEIDANLSGEESEGVAKVLKALSKSYQVFAISHQPHLPSVADSHFLVQKGERGSQIRKLDFEERVSEIARMISGSHLSQEALNFARKKLSNETSSS